MSGPPIAPFTGRQWQIAGLIRQGKRNQEIASALGLSLSTVREYVHRIMQRLCLRNRTAIAVWMLRHPPQGGSPGEPGDHL